jgi:hypothetical protein
MSLAAQRLFADKLLGKDHTSSDGLTSRNGAHPERRFAIHRNNVRSGLIRVLATRFPVAEKLVGEAFFAGMASAFIAQHPPRSPSLLDYGDDLAAFVETFAPATELPYLPDVIRLEAARSRAYHAADQSPLDPEALAGLGPEALTNLTFIAHPSASIVSSAHPVVTIWAMHAGELELAPIEAWLGEDALVTRPHLTVWVRRLPPGGASFLATLMSGTTLGAAAELALGAAPEFDLAANLASLLQSGALMAIDRALTP